MIERLAQEVEIMRAEPAKARRGPVDAAVAAERERLRGMVEAVRDANHDATDGYTVRLLTPGQKRAWLALLAGVAP